MNTATAVINAMRAAEAKGAVDNEEAFVALRVSPSEYASLDAEEVKDDAEGIRYKIAERDGWAVHVRIKDDG